MINFDFCASFGFYSMGCLVWSDVSKSWSEMS